MKNSIRHTKEAELAVLVLVIIKLLAIERYMHLCSSVLYHEGDYPIYLYIYIYISIYLSLILPDVAMLMI